MRVAEKTAVPLPERRKGRREGLPDAMAEALQQHRRGIQRELEKIFRRLRENDVPESGDEGEQAAYGFERELGSARVDQLTQVRRQIDDALARHAQGRYGRCVACDVNIPVARLRSLPFALYCRDCQARAEEKRGKLLMSLARAGKSSTQLLESPTGE